MIMFILLVVVLACIAVGVALAGVKSQPCGPNCRGLCRVRCNPFGAYYVNCEPPNMSSSEPPS